MRDFTLEIYETVLKNLDSTGYIFSTYEDYISNSKNKVVILRHDVDKLPSNALRMAKFENRLGIKASYYFRMVKESYDEDVIRQIMDMGHEIGYHYEDLDLSWRGLRSEVRGQEKIEVGLRPVGAYAPVGGLRSEVRRQKKIEIGGLRSEVRGQKGLDYDALLDKAIKSFERNLEKLRKLYPVKTICMHGSPFSKYDNKEIWEKYDYRDYGIIAEPYFDIDFDEVFYITDTGRSWNHSTASVRDKVNSKFDIKIKDTQDLIEKIKNNKLPDKIMMNVHPQRWNDHGFHWYKELVGQNFKNVIKRCLIKLRG